MVASAAATQAPMDRTSCTRPRLKARSADSRITPRTPRSTRFRGKLAIAGSVLLRLALGRRAFGRARESFDQPGKMVDRMELQAAGRGFAPVAQRRNQGGGKAQFLRLPQALL